jgi:hypothetical protein
MGLVRSELARMVLKKILSLAVAGVLLGWGYDWASRRLYDEADAARFWRGVLHGAVMPAALPSLLIGKDVPIFAPLNDGRGYKLGYICGINLCGLVFFGLAFRPARKTGGAKTASDDTPR